MLRFDSITKYYRMGKQQVRALDRASGEISQREMVALCGPSGSGKSTLLNILGLLEMNFEGVVSFNGCGYPKSAKEAAELRRTQFGFVFQKFNLVPVMTALENVAYPLFLNGYSREQQQLLATEMLERVGLAQLVNQRPDNLSGGQQQRVAIARALVHKPKVVIADEPTASLDSDTANIVIDIMRSLGHELNSSFIIATHDPRMANRCDRIIELVDGTIKCKEEL